MEQMESRISGLDQTIDQAGWWRNWWDPPIWDWWEEAAALDAADAEAVAVSARGNARAREFEERRIRVSTQLGRSAAARRARGYSRSRYLYPDEQVDPKVGAINVRARGTASAAPESERKPSLPVRFGLAVRRGKRRATTFGKTFVFAALRFTATVVATTQRWGWLARGALRDYLQSFEQQGGEGAAE